MVSEQLPVGEAGDDQLPRAAVEPGDRRGLRGGASPSASGDVLRDDRGGETFAGGKAVWNRQESERCDSGMCAETSKRAGSMLVGISVLPRGAADRRDDREAGVRADHRG